MPFLETKDVVLKYGEAVALNGISLEVAKSERVALLGGNGAGKSSFVNAVSGIEPIAKGEIRLDGEKINGLPPHDIVKKGICQIPEGRLVFPKMTVWENLELGATALKDTNKKKELLEQIFSLFPIIEKRLNQMAGTMSGGEQQMLAVARALMSDPKVILSDEISMGLAPIVAREIYKNLLKISIDRGVTLVIVEQDAKLAFSIVDYCYVFENGKIINSGNSKELAQDDNIRKIYLGET